MTVAEVHDIAGLGDNHIVQFYESEEELFVEVGRYVSTGLHRGGTAILVATEAHHRGFDAELKRLGIDVEGARRCGRIITLDAPKLASELMTEGTMDAGVFRSVVGATVQKKASAGRGVRIYGEVVSLLWEAGDVLAAIELESLWNDLGKVLPFSLMCAYREDSVGGAEHAEALEQLCGLHSWVVRGTGARPHGDDELSGFEIVAHFPCDVHSARSARHFVVTTMLQWGFAPALLDDAALVTTELAANAVVHACSKFSVVLRAERGVVRICVHDAGRFDGVKLIVRQGRGLGLLAELSNRWGMDPSVGGKVVWAELGTPRGESSS